MASSGRALIRSKRFGQRRMCTSIEVYRLARDVFNVPVIFLG
jgi:hypothetical protein